MRGPRRPSGCHRARPRPGPALRSGPSGACGGLDPTCARCGEATIVDGRLCRCSAELGPDRVPHVDARPAHQPTPWPAAAGDRRNSVPPRRGCERDTKARDSRRRSIRQPHRAGDGETRGTRVPRTGPGCRRTRTGPGPVSTQAASRPPGCGAIGGRRHASGRGRSVCPALLRSRSLEQHRQGSIENRRDVAVWKRVPQELLNAAQLLVCRATQRDLELVELWG